MKINLSFLLFVFCFGAFLYILVGDLNRTEDETYQEAHKSRTGKGTGLALMLVQEKFGKTGVVLYHGTIGLLATIGMGLVCLYEVKKNKKQQNNEIAFIMDLFAQERSHSVSEISSYLKIPEDEVRQLLEQLSAQNKIVRMGDDVYWRYEE